MLRTSMILFSRLGAEKQSVASLFQKAIGKPFNNRPSESDSWNKTKSAICGIALLRNSICTPCEATSISSQPVELGTLRKFSVLWHENLDGSAPSFPGFLAICSIRHPRAKEGCGLCSQWISEILIMYSSCFRCQTTLPFPTTDIGK